MAFLSIHVPEFMVQAIVRAEPELRDRAVALVDGTPPIWIVVAANRAALQCGIELGMAKSQAEEFRGVQIRHRSRSQEKTAHGVLLELGWSISPRMEDTAVDTVVLDLAGLTSLFGAEQNIAHDLVARASDLGLAARIAVSSNLDAAVHASRGFPGITLIPEGEEAERIAGLPLEALSPSPEILEILASWGVPTCGALAALPVLPLSERLGQDGVRLHEMARGAFTRSMVLAGPAATFEEEIELENAVAELEPLAFLLGRLLDRLGRRLAMHSLAASAIRCKLDLEPFYETIFELSAQAPRPKSESKTYETILSLPVPMQDSKMLLKLLRLRLQADPPGGAILKITLAADPARPRVLQGGLFLPAAPDPEKLELTVARLASVVGESNIGSPELMDTHRPEGFRMKRFTPSNKSSRAPRKKATSSETIEYQEKHRDQKHHRHSEARSLTGLRIFRPALSARVELWEGRPARVFFRDMRGEVAVASGPWRTSGDWWQQGAWQQDEWDLEIQFTNVQGAAVHRLPEIQAASQTVPPSVKSKNDRRVRNPTLARGVYRFVYDFLRQSWFVWGMYD